MSLFLIALAAIFSVINPLGTVPIFVGLTKEKTKKEINKIALATAINVLIILLISFYLGKFILLFFGISLNSLKIAGGLIIASSGFALLTGKFSQHKGMNEKNKNAAMERDEVSLTPLAIPMLAGPGTISLLITYHQEYTQVLERGILTAAILVISVLIYITLRSSNLIIKALGPNGINALSRIIGFIVIAIGVEYILSTVILLLK
ncbi:MAG: NAAT family transporter [Bacteroidetes bacterium]|jgi:multiple antibiotic resistance protein|nr:NAAT family transporter [Bacteroidota bacterium]